MEASSIRNFLQFFSLLDFLYIVHGQYSKKKKGKKKFIPSTVESLTVGNSILQRLYSFDFLNPAKRNYTLIR